MNNPFNNKLTFSNMKTSIDTNLSNSQNLNFNNNKTNNNDLKHINEIKKRNENDKIDLLKYTRDKINKDSLILSLEKDLEYEKNNNKNFINYQKYADKIVKYYEKNLKEISKFESDKKIELKEFILMCENYEKDIQTIIDDKEILIKSSEELLQNKKEEQKKLNLQLSQITKDVNNQSELINELNSTISDLKIKLENKNNKFEQDEKNYIDDYDELLFNFNNLEKRYNYLIDIDNERENEIKGDDIKIRNNKSNEIEIDLKNKENEIKEEYLKGVIKDLNKKIEILKNKKHKNDLEKERIKFLGKALAGRLRERKEINEKIEQQNDIKNLNNNRKLRSAEHYKKNYFKKEFDFN